ncbi:MAG: Cna B-type domain-containing protein, partial [Mogibacterium sp.]|nr:Cna B-type domain-containing protein [Mogibacterium sp.]
DGKYNVSIEGDMASGYVITNSNDPDTVSVTAIKQWYGDADVKEDTRKDVRLLLLGHVSEDREDQLAYVGVDQKIKVDMDADVETDAGSVTWKDLPKYVDGQEIIWTVIEESVPGYTFSVGQRTGQDGKTTDGKAEFVVTNEYIGSVSEVTATKIWEDGNNRDGKRDDVWFQLYRKIGESDEEKVGDPKKVAVNKTAADGTNAGEVTWTKLPDIIAETIEDGTEDVYNPVDPEPKVGSAIPTDVEWYEADGSDSYKPTEDETVLEGKTYYTKTTETIKKEMPERSVVYWVKELNADGDEVAPDGYESTVVQTEPGVFEVRNIHVPETTSVFAKKVWNDEEDAESIRPDHITIRLKADGEKKEDAVITSKADGWNQGDSAAAGSSIYVFDNLPKYKNGTEIEYSVVELDSDDDKELDGTSGKDKTSYNYTVAPITGSGTAADDPYVLINTYNPADEIKLTVTKKWADDEKVKKTSRKDIELTLIEVIDGARKEKETVTLELPDDVDGEMSYTWDNLDATYKHQAVSYTVEERNIPEGYTASVGDTRKVEGKDNEFTIEVTNTYHEVIPSEDVIYVDPKNASGRMVVKSTTYDSPTEASAAANNKTGKPADPKHKNVRFLGWDVNYDNNGNYVLVATYSDIPSSPTPVVSYIDPQSGKVLVSKQTDKPSSVKAPADPKAKNMQFTGWAVVTDSAGNTMYLAQYECDCSNGGGGGKDVDKSNVQTGDDAMLTVWMLLFVMAVSLMVLTMMLRNRSINVVRDTYKPKH